jgi:hypothetical protein
MQAGPYCGLLLREVNPVPQNDQVVSEPLADLAELGRNPPPHINRFPCRIEQAAKYGLRLALANQNPERLSAETFNAISTNASHTWATALNSRGAAVIAKEWGGRPDPAALTNLSRYRFLTQVTHRGESSKPFAVEGVQAEAILGSGQPDRVAELDAAIEANAGRRSPAEVGAELDTLDDRIGAALETRGGERDDGEASRGAFRISAGGSA